jgi:putative hydrolase of the HAD superfamily
MEGFVARWIAKLGLTEDEFSERVKQAGWETAGTGGVSEEEMFQNLCLACAMNEMQSAEFIEDFWTVYLGTPNIEITEYFRALRPRYQTAMLSNSGPGARRREQERYGFEDLTDLIVYSHEEGIEKPDRRIYELTWQRLGIQPEEMIFVDDAPPNIEAARALGIHGILFQNTAQVITEIEALLKTRTLP